MSTLKLVYSISSRHRGLDYETKTHEVPRYLGDVFLKTSRTLIGVYEGELTLRVGNEAITYNLDQTSRYSVNYNDMTANRINVVELACEEYSQEILGFSDVISSGIPTPYYDLIVLNSSPTLTPFGDSDFLLLEEADAFLALADDPTSPEELKICKAKTAKSSIDEPPEVELKDLPPYLEYAFLEDNNKLPVIIAKYLSAGEKTALIKVLKSRKQAIAWKLSDIKDMLSKFVNANTASSSSTGTLPSNTVTNPKEDLKGITTRSDVAYKGPTIPTTPSPKVVERETEDFPSFLRKPTLFLAIRGCDPTSPELIQPNNEKSSVNEHPEVELKDLPPHLEYAFLEVSIPSGRIFIVPAGSKKNVGRDPKGNIIILPPVFAEEQITQGISDWLSKPDFEVKNNSKKREVHAKAGIS
ncbi:hypothetical protein Tco_0445149 [Tanacetum coccineum]